MSEHFLKSTPSAFAHEFSHLLPSDYKPWGGNGLPDLYGYEQAGKGERDRFVDGWDIMGDFYQSRTPGFSAYNKLLLGWVEAKTIALSSGKVYTENLTPLEMSSGLRVIKIPLTKTTYYLIEVRKKVGFDKNLPGEGVMIYLIDETRKSGYGIVQVEDHIITTKSLNDAYFQVGSRFEDKTHHVYLYVTQKNGDMYTVVISSSPVSTQTVEIM
jgi:hypothetical protein